MSDANESATQVLRALLDERGVEWQDGSDENVLHTTWNGMNCWFNEFPDGWTAWGMAMRGTPEQAIEATLGAGTCEADETDTIKCWVKCKDEPSTEHMELIHVMECSSCGKTYEHVNGAYEYCPHCRAKVVDE